LETGNLWLGRGGFHVSQEFVDARETFGGVVALECVVFHFSADVSDVFPPVT
jgi:hypothetical protein